MAAEEYAVEHLHVLRHRFLPSEQLSRALAEMSMLPPRATMPRFFLLSTRIVALDVKGVHNDEYSDELQGLDADLAAKMRGPQYAAMAIGDASARYNPGDNSLNLFFTPARQNLFRILTDPLLEVGIPLTNTPGEVFQVTASIRQQVVAREAIQKAQQVWQRVKEGIASPDTSHMYTISPHSIVGKDVVRRVKLPTAAPEVAPEAAL